MVYGTGSESSSMTNAPRDRVVPAPFARRRPGSADGTGSLSGMRGESDDPETGGIKQDPKARRRSAPPKGRGEKPQEERRPRARRGGEASPVRGKPVPPPAATAGTKAAGAARRQRRRKWANRLSYLLFVVIPTVVVGLYYAFVAADQYKVETRFAVRSTTPGFSDNLLSSLGLGVSGTSSSDAYIVLEYIKSREILQRIDKRLDLRERYRRASDDLWAALPAGATFEDFVDYWRWMVQVELDRPSYILTIETFAFTAEDARDIARAILDESERMINEINERARIDAVAYAENEVRKAEARLREVRRKMLAFRSTTQQIDPAKQAQVQVALIGKLEEQLAQERAKLVEARSYMNERAPTIIYLKNRIRALEKQIAEEKLKLGNRPQKRNGGPRGSTAGSDATLSTTLSEYEALLVEREFAEKFYLSTLTGLEQARLLANRQQRYLATFLHPYLPDDAEYPKRIRNTIFVFLALSLVWGLGLLMLQSVRDRM